MASGIVQSSPGAAALAVSRTGFHTKTSSEALMPSGFPLVLTTDAAWIGAEIAAKPSEYIYHLSPSDIEEVEEALVKFKALALDGDQVNRETFPLVRLGLRLASVSQDIHNGRGFAVIRGLEPEKYKLEDLTLIHLGIQAQVADQQGCQDKKGNMLVHIVADKSTAQKAEHHRHSTSSIPFHNEEKGDIVTWLTRSTAVAGGKCIIASGHTVYNILAATRPDIVRLLARSDWPFALPRFKCRPVLFHHNGRIIINFGRTPLLGSAAHPRPTTLPILNARQIEALDAIESIAKATQFEIQTRPGDIHFINNLVILHRREAFVDGDVPEQRRHLVRMILRDSKLGWSIPGDLEREWYDAFEKEIDRSWHLDPMPEGYFPIRTYPN